MRVKAALIAAAVALALVGFALAVAVARGASSHQSGCHSQHTCPSDHHTYVWTDQTTGLLWDCAEPGASEYDPARDTTVIVYPGFDVLLPLCWPCRYNHDSADDQHRVDVDKHDDHVQSNIQDDDL